MDVSDRSMSGTPLLARAAPDHLHQARLIFTTISTALITREGCKSGGTSVSLCLLSCSSSVQRTWWNIAGDTLCHPQISANSVTGWAVKNAPECHDLIIAGLVEPTIDLPYAVKALLQRWLKSLR